MNVHEFSVAMLTTNGSIKTPTAIAKEAGKSQSSGSRLLTGLSTASLDFVPTAKNFLEKKQLILLQTTLVYLVVMQKILRV